MSGTNFQSRHESTAGPEGLTFFWNGKPYPAQAGDTIASALWRQGIRTLGCSRKRHRPMGLSGNYLQGILVTVGGRPHARADEVLVSQGLQVSQQNVWPSARWDLLRLLRFIPARWIRGGFEHPRVLPGGTYRFAIWERLLMFLAGEIDVSPKPTRSSPQLTGRRIDTDVLVVGGGPAGREAANTAAGADRRTVLVSTSRVPGTNATLFGVELPSLNSAIEVLTEHTIVAVYRSGTAVLAVPLNPALAATLIVTKQLILATGRRSIPPLVPGHDIPGVLESHAAVKLASHIGQAMGSTVVVGNGAQQEVADALARFGVPIVAALDLSSLERIEGSTGVTAAKFQHQSFDCRNVVHVGPFMTDPGLQFQAAALGTLRLTSEGVLPSNVTFAGTAALLDETPYIGRPETLEDVAVCPCMDATVDEVLALVRGGQLHVEVLKRATSCGMGPCQGFPCWELLRSLIRRETGGHADLDRPTHRPPRRGITVEQAAGLDGLLELD